MARDAIESMQADGLQPTLDHISELIDLARKIQEPEHRTWQYLSYEGIRAGSSHHILRPFTIKSGRWFDFISDKISNHLLMFACAYAMEKGHDKNIDFVPLYDLETAQTTLIDYANKLTCNGQELSEAIDRCTEKASDGDRYRAKRNKSTSASVEQLIAELVAVTGQPEEYWLSKTSTFAMQVLIHAINHAASMYGGVDLEKKELHKAEFDFACCVDRIERELKGLEAFTDAE